jgi:FAD/FMN-containing dehydrogenase
VLAGCGTGEEGDATVTQPGAGRRIEAAIQKRAPRTLAEAIRGPVLRPGDRGYSAAARVFNERFDGVRPHAVATPLDADDVLAALRFTTTHGIRIRARSGGHSYAGYSTFADGVVIDLRRLAHVSVDHRAGTATVGAGAQLIDVLSTLARHGATLPVGSCPSVGIAGVTLGGGFGVASRRLGLTADHLLGARVVTADGALRTVNGRADRELLWALRGGGGGNFGVVTDFTFRIRSLPSVATFFSVTWPWGDAGDAVDAWQRWAPNAPETITSILHLNSVRRTRCRACWRRCSPRPARGCSISGRARTCRCSCSWPGAGN